MLLRKIKDTNFVFSLCCTCAFRELSQQSQEHQPSIYSNWKCKMSFYIISCDAFTSCLAHWTCIWLKGMRPDHIVYMVVIPLFLAYGYTGWWFILYGRRVERKTEAENAGWTSAFIQLCLSRYFDASFTWKIYQLMAKKLHIIMFSPLYQQTFEVELLPHSLYSSPANPAYIKQCRYCTYSAGGYKEAHFYILCGEYNYLNIYRWHIFVTL